LQIILIKMLCIADLLTADHCARLRAGFAALPAVDGALSAGWAARGSKRNRQLGGRDPGVAALAAEVVAAVAAHPLLRRYARPARLSTPLLSAYAGGESYGLHVDDALMGEPPLRTDLAWTLFLSEPDRYEGGELVLDGHAGETPVKLPAGALLLYD